MAQTGIQPLDHLPVGTLLGAEHGGRAVLAAQGVLDIAQHGKGALLQTGVGVSHVDFFNFMEVSARGDEGRAVALVKPHAAGRGTAAAAVIGGAAPQTDIKLPRTLVQRVANQLTHAIGGGALGVFLGSNQRQTGTGRHLDDGSAVGQQAVNGGHGRKMRAADGTFHPLAAQRGQKGIHGAFAAVSHGDGHHLCPGAMAQNGPRHGGAHLCGGKGSLEGIGDEKDGFHNAPPFFADFCRFLLIVE